jgi:N6-adenosine-specific RNA methylase IME4
MSSLVKYDEACRALAAAVSVDEVMALQDTAEMMRAAARIAKNRDLEMQAIELRMRGERRLGELIAAQKKEFGLNRGGRPSEKTCSPEEQVSQAGTLAEAGIDRKLSSRAQKLAAVPAEKFEGMIGAWKEESALNDARLTTNLLKVGAEEEQRVNRRNLANELSETSFELSGTRKYACIYADPPWLRKQGVTNRSYENHYPTMTWDEIMKVPVADRVLPDAWLFLWIPRAHMFALHKVTLPIELEGGPEAFDIEVELPLAWAIARAWGFDNYCTAFVWTKTDEEHPDDIGGGILVRDQDEILLMFKRGTGLPKPRSDEKFTSNHRERAREHSRKPDHYRKMIASMAGVRVLELFARVDQDNPLPPGFDAWGNQAQEVSREIKTMGHESSDAVSASAANLPVDGPLDIPPFLRRNAEVA